jgi:DNA modification methylase
VTEIAYETDLGAMLHSTVEDALESRMLQELEGKIDLIFTSPPFPLTSKKTYGNLDGQKYLDWLSGLAKRFETLLSPTGSMVIEIGNAWEPGAPVMQTWPMRALLGILDSTNLHLCQTFVCHNPARLPGPATWVNIQRIRVKDSYTNIWWMSPSQRPKADNRRVLTEYSPGMKRLLKTQTYNSGTRPSGHRINDTSFLTENKGAIPPNGLNIEEGDPYAVNFLEIANTSSRDNYEEYCKYSGLEVHPARMQAPLAEFFIRFLTEPGDLVFDPFAGSNTTGAKAEELGRRWIATEPEFDYVAGSVARFNNARDPVTKANTD